MRCSKNVKKNSLMRFFCVLFSDFFRIEKSVCVLALLAVTSIPFASSASMYLDENGVTWYYQKLNDDSAIIVNNGDNSAFSSAIDPAEVTGEISIPSKIYDLTVVRLGEKAFYDCDKITSVVIPKSVRDIGAECFYECYDLVQVILPDSVEIIGDNAFYWCSSLQNLTIPAKVRTIGECAFWKCSGITNAVFLSNDTHCSLSIGNEAFYGCSSLQNVSLSSNVVSIGKSAFQGCSTLEQLEISSNLTDIGENAFYKCKKLFGAISFPSKLIRISDNAFSGCSSIESIFIEEGDKYTEKLSISKGAFFGCTSVTNLYIPDRTENIGEGAFQSLSSLVSVKLPSGMETIADSLFTACESLARVDIPASVTEIGSSAFYYNTNLMHFAIPPNTENIGSMAFMSTAWWNSQPDNSVLIKDGWVLGVKGTCPSEVVLSSNVTHIADGAFSGCETLTNIVMSESVVSIGELAFRNCTNLTSVVISADTYIDPTAFYDSSWYPTGNGGGVVIDPSVAVTNYFVAFNPNGGDGNVITQTFRYGYVKSLLSNEFTRATFRFDGWSVSATGAVKYVDGETVSNLVEQADGTLSLYAHWTQLTNLYNIVFKPNGGKGSMDAQKIAIGEKQKLSPNKFVRSDFVFKGWAVSPTGEVEYADCELVSNLSTNIGEKVSLYAKWRYIGVSLSEKKGNLTWYYSISTNGTATIVNMGDDEFTTAVEGEIGESLVIPKSLGGKRVVSISENAFKGLSQLKSVHIPSSVERISAGAFSGCDGITSVVMSMADTLKSVFPDSFAKIQSVAVHGTDEFLENEVWLSESSFAECKSLVSVSLPLGVLEIPDSAFEGCVALKEFEMPYTVTTIGERAFAGCSSMETITVTENVDTIGANAFTDCLKLRIVRYLGNEPSDVSGGDTENIYYHSKSDLVSGYLDNIRSWPSAKKSADGSKPVTPLPDKDDADLANEKDEEDDDKKEEESVVSKPNGEIKWPEGAAGRKLIPWTTEKYSFKRVVFNYNDGGKTPSKEVFYVKGRVLGELPLEDDNDSFIGWFTERYGGKEIDPYYVVDASAVFYAHWETDAEEELDRGGLVEPFEPFYETESEKGFSFEAATFDGLLMDDDTVAGIIEVKTKRGKYVKSQGGTNSAFTAKIHLLGERKFSMSGTIDETGAASIDSERTGRSLDLEFTQFGLEGSCSTEYGDYSVIAARDRFSAKSEEAQRYVRVAIANAKHDWMIVLPTDDEVGGEGTVPNGYSTLSISVSSQGKVKIKGQMADGTKVSASSKLIVGDGCCCIPVFVPLYSGKRGGFAFALWFTWSSDQSESIVTVDGVSQWDAQLSRVSKFIATFGDPIISKAGTAVLPETMIFQMDEFFDVYGVEDTYSPNETKFSVSQGRWKLPKADSVRFSKDEGWYTVEEKDYGNPAGLKLSYSIKTGLFKGSFNVYATTESERPKKYSAKVSGVVAGGVGYGTATIKNIGSVKITISDFSEIKEK